MSMTTRTDRLPDPCPLDPGHRAFMRESRTAGTAEEPIVTLSQYRCANGCGAPRGWKYRGRAIRFRHGEGECRDPEVFREMEHEAYWNGLANRVGLTLLGTAAAGVAAWALPTIITDSAGLWGPVQAWGVAATTAIGTPIAVLVAWRGIRRAPKAAAPEGALG